jgi:hypothetical protein
VELEPQFKELVQELGHAINDSLAESPGIADVMGRIRASGYDLFLVLEVTVGFNRRGATTAGSPTEAPETLAGKAEFRLSNQDTQFLRSLRISIEDEGRGLPKKVN